MPKINGRYGHLVDHGVFPTMENTVPHIYNDVSQLEGKEKAGDGDCVDLLKAYVPGPRSFSARACWIPGERVIDARRLVKGTAIATFVKGRYPNGNSGQHAAIFLSHAGPNSFWVMDQWKGKPKIKARLIYAPKPGVKQRADGSWPDASNVAPAFAVIELSCPAKAK